MNYMLGNNLDSFSGTLLDVFERLLPELIMHKGLIQLTHAYIFRPGYISFIELERKLLSKIPEGKKENIQDLISAIDGMRFLSETYYLDTPSKMDEFLDNEKKGTFKKVKQKALGLGIYQ